VDRGVLQDVRAEVGGEESGVQAAERGAVGQQGHLVPLAGGELVDHRHADHAALGVAEEDDPVGRGQVFDPVDQLGDRPLGVAGRGQRVRGPRPEGAQVPQHADHPPGAGVPVGLAPDVEQAEREEADQRVAQVGDGPERVAEIEESGLPVDQRADCEDHGQHQQDGHEATGHLLERGVEPPPGRWGHRIGPSLPPHRQQYQAHGGQQDQLRAGDDQERGRHPGQGGGGARVLLRHRDPPEGRRDQSGGAPRQQRDRPASARAPGRRASRHSRTMTASGISAVTARCWPAPCSEPSQRSRPTSH
jgi:hypothetical protein